MSDDIEVFNITFVIYRQEKKYSVNLLLFLSFCYFLLLKSSTSLFPENTQTHGRTRVEWLLLQLMRFT